MTVRWLDNTTTGTDERGMLTRDEDMDAQSIKALEQRAKDLGLDGLPDDFDTSDCDCHVCYEEAVEELKQIARG